jgi:Mg/Co/Ni transporter MgtE
MIRINTQKFISSITISVRTRDNLAGKLRSGAGTKILKRRNDVDLKLVTNLLTKQTTTKPPQSTRLLRRPDITKLKEKGGEFLTELERERNSWIKKSTISFSLKQVLSNAGIEIKDEIEIGDNGELLKLYKALNTNGRIVLLDALDLDGHKVLVTQMNKGGRRELFGILEKGRRSAFFLSLDIVSQQHFYCAQKQNNREVLLSELDPNGRNIFINLMGLEKRRDLFEKLCGKSESDFKSIEPKIKEFVKAIKAKNILTIFKELNGKTRVNFVNALSVDQGKELFLELNHEDRLSFLEDLNGENQPAFWEALETEELVNFIKQIGSDNILSLFWGKLEKEAYSCVFKRLKEAKQLILFSRLDKISFGFLNKELKTADLLPLFEILEPGYFSPAFRMLPQEDEKYVFEKLSNKRRLDLFKESACACQGSLSILLDLLDNKSIRALFVQLDHKGRSDLFLGLKQKARVNLIASLDTLALRVLFGALNNEGRLTLLFILNELGQDDLLHQLDIKDKIAILQGLPGTKEQLKFLKMLDEPERQEVLTDSAQRKFLLDLLEYKIPQKLSLALDQCCSLQAKNQIDWIHIKNLIRDLSNASMPTPLFLEKDLEYKDALELFSVKQKKLAGLYRTVQKTFLKLDAQNRRNLFYVLEPDKFNGFFVALAEKRRVLYEALDNEDCRSMYRLLDADNQIILFNDLSTINRLGLLIELGQLYLPDLFRRLDNTQRMAFFDAIGEENYKVLFDVLDVWDRELLFKAIDEKRQIKLITSLRKTMEISEILQLVKDEGRRALFESLSVDELWALFDLYAREGYGAALFLALGKPQQKLLLPHLNFMQRLKLLSELGDQAKDLLSLIDINEQLKLYRVSIDKVRKNIFKCLEKEDKKLLFGKLRPDERQALPKMLGGDVCCWVFATLEKTEQATWFDQMDRQGRRILFFNSGWEQSRALYDILNSEQRKNLFRIFDATEYPIFMQALSVRNDIISFRDFYDQGMRRPQELIRSLEGSDLQSLVLALDRNIQIQLMNALENEDFRFLILAIQDDARRALFDTRLVFEDGIKIFDRLDDPSCLALFNALKPREKAVYAGYLQSKFPNLYQEKFLPYFIGVRKV